MSDSRKYIILISILVAYSGIRSQKVSCNKDVESLYTSINYFENSQEYSILDEKISFLYELRKKDHCLGTDYKFNQLLFSYYLSQEEIDSAFKYIRIIHLCELDDLSLKAKDELKLSDFLLKHLFIDSSFKYVNSSLERYTKLANKKGIISCYRILSNIYLFKGKKEKCLYYYEEAIALADTSNPSLEVGLLYSNQGLLNYEEGNYDLALGYAIKALNVFKKINNNKLIAISYNRIAIIMAKLELTQDAINYLLDGLQEAKKNKDTYTSAVIANNLGIAYANNKQDSLALVYLKNALVYFNQKADAIGQISCLASIGDISLKNEKYDSASLHYMKAIDIAEANNLTKPLSSIYLNLSKLYLKTTKNQLAEQSLKKSYLISKKLNLKEDIKDYYLTYAEINSKKGLYDSAYYYQGKGFLLQEEIQGQEVKHLVQQLKIKFEADLKELENEKLQTALESKKKQNILLILLLIAIGLILTSTSILFIYRYRNKKLQYQATKLKLDNLKKVISDKNQLISSLEKEAIDSESNLATQITEKLLIEQNWMEFMIEFERLYTNFFSDIKSKHEKLTKNDLRFIALLKLNLNDKEIAHLLNIEHDSVRKTKYRIRNKIDNDPSLLSILNN